MRELFLFDNNTTSKCCISKVHGSLKEVESEGNEKREKSDIVGMKRNRVKSEKN